LRILAKKNSGFQLRVLAKQERVPIEGISETTAGSISGYWRNNSKF